MKILTVVIKHWQLFASQSGVYTNISHNLKTLSSEQLQRIEKTYHQGYFIRPCKENLDDQPTYKFSVNTSDDWLSYSVLRQKG